LRRRISAFPRRSARAGRSRETNPCWYGDISTVWCRTHDLCFLSTSGRLQPIRKQCNKLVHQV